MWDRANLKKDESEKTKFFNKEDSTYYELKFVD